VSASRPWLRTSQAAARLHVSAKTVTRWANDGRLQHRRTLGGHRRYDPALIDALVDALTYRPQPPPPARLEGASS
jgi:excisionase family DNA binding protein